MFSMATATAYAVNTPTDKKNTCIVKIESKSKTVNYQITWNANGGKIGSKKTVATTVKKGSKINKIAATPKRSGYTFKGFYTKKSGGTKINKNTKPTKSVTYYAHWEKTKKTTVDTSKIVGGPWKHKRFEIYNPPSGAIIFREYYFHQNGKFEFYEREPLDVLKVEGKYSVSKGIVHFKERKVYSASLWGEKSPDIRKLNYKFELSWEDMASTYKVGSDKDGAYLSISKQGYGWITDVVEGEDKYRK